MLISDGFHAIHALVVTVVLGYCFVDFILRDISIELYRVRAKFCVWLGASWRRWATLKIQARA
jgi:uncharacterized membrane protein